LSHTSPSRGYNEVLLTCFCHHFDREKSDCLYIFYNISTTQTVYFYTRTSFKNIYVCGPWICNTQHVYLKEGDHVVCCFILTFCFRWHSDLPVAENVSLCYQEWGNLRIMLVLCWKTKCQNLLIKIEVVQ
jgi:hypothetical protein